MDSLNAFLSEYVLFDAEDNQSIDKLSVFLQNGQPTRVIDSAGQPHLVTIVSIADPESLTEEDIAALDIVTEQPEWIVIIDHTNQVRGVVEPEGAEELQIAVKEQIKKGVFGTTLPGFVEVTVSYYGCLKHPEAGRYALHQKGAPVPRCPYDEKPMTKLQEKSKRPKTK